MLDNFAAIAAVADLLLASEHLVKATASALAQIHPTTALVASSGPITSSSLSYWRAGDHPPMRIRPSKRTNCLNAWVRKSCPSPKWRSTFKSTVCQQACNIASKSDAQVLSDQSLGEGQASFKNSAPQAKWVEARELRNWGPGPHQFLWQL